ncbi:MAG: signal peptidase I [Candidatus Margulisiibacteriota bacterium]
MPNRLKHWVFDWTETIVVAFIMALIIRAFFLQVFWIPSSSMEPTLDIQDRIVVNKVAYYFRTPKRQEIVVFRQVADPDKPEGRPKRDLIKRVMGLPGEILKIRDGVVYINDQKIEETHPMNSDYSDFGPKKIPSDAYFVLGDNRPASADSRYWGFLPKANLIGPAFIRIWPLTKLTTI